MRGNFTPPSGASADAEAPPGPGAFAAAPLPPAGGRLSPRNWRVPTRLNAILLIPVLVGLVMGGFQVKGSIDTWHEAQDAENTARLVRSALTYSERLIDERDISAAPLLRGDKKSPEVAKARAATDQAAQAFDAATRQMPDKEGLKRRLAAFHKVEPQLAQLRARAYTPALKGVATEEGYVAIQHPLMQFANELGLGTGNITSYGRTVYAISLAKAALSLERSIGMHLLVHPGPSPADLVKQRTAFSSYAYLEGIAVEEYRSGGTQADVDALDAATAKLQEQARKQAAANAAAAKAAGRTFVQPPSPEQALTALASLPSTRASDRAALASRGITQDAWWQTTTAKFSLYRGIESDLADKAVREASGIADNARRDTFVTGAVVLVALLAAFVLAGLMARQMSRSMRRLRGAALDIAQERLPLLVDQLSRTDPGQVDTRVTPLPITSTDEIGEVARAFDQVHREAVRLAAEQALLRGNINAIFTNLSRRNQSLIEGQLTLITDLENNEADPDQLENLFRLDHLATRMRRNGENLLVLSGEEPGRRWDQPIPLLDVVRAAASEVERYDRIEMTGLPDAEIHGSAVTDLIHLLAELLENATSFSSPQSRVLVTATRLPDDRVMIEIHDRGIGLTPEDFADLNHKLANPPIVDATVSQRMGLFVVGRLSDRHGIKVQLRPASEEAGTTSLVMLPAAITHGGGDKHSDSEFTVSSIIPRQAAHSAKPLRTAAELGFDDSRYDDAHEAALDPVGRSLLRGERRAALEAQAAQPQRPAADHETYAPMADGRAQPGGNALTAPAAPAELPGPNGGHPALGPGPYSFGDGSALDPAVPGGFAPRPDEYDGSGAAQPRSGFERQGGAYGAPAGAAGLTGYEPSGYAFQQPYEGPASTGYGGLPGYGEQLPTGGQETPGGVNGQHGQGTYAQDGGQTAYPADTGRDGAGGYGRPSALYQEAEETAQPGAFTQRLRRTDAPDLAYLGPFEDVAAQDRHDGYAEAGDRSRADAPFEPTAGYDAGSRQGGWGHGNGFSTSHNDQYAAQPESASGADESPVERVGSDRPGPAPSVPQELTDAGLPRRGSTARGQSGPAAAGQRWRPDAGTDNRGPVPADGAGGGDQGSFKDERWERAEQLRRPRAGGVTLSGLPRRVPKANLVDGAAGAVDKGSPDGPQVSRAPEDIRGRLSSLRRGVLRGRNAGSDTNGQATDQHGGHDSTYDQER